MEKAIFINFFTYLSQNKLITSFQSGFLPGDSTVMQLIDVYDTICAALDEGKEVRAVFCDIQAFDRVWHRGLIRKLQSYGVKGQMLSWFSSYLSDRSQCVVIEGVKSSTRDIHAGVPQGSILGPLLFLLYINDIVTDITSNIRLFADDTSLYLVVEDPVTAATVMNNDLEKIDAWSKRWLVKFSAQKTKSILFSRKRLDRYHPPLLDRASLKTLYMTQVRPIIEYADCIWSNISQHNKDRLENLQLEAARIITGAPRGTSHASLYKESALETLTKRQDNHQLVLYYKMVHGTAPEYLSIRARVPQHQPHTHNLRHNENNPVWTTGTASYQKSFLPSTIKAWNNLKNKSLAMPVYYNTGKRLIQIIHANMRMESSNLQYHLFLRHLSDDPSCMCGAPVEDPKHFLMVCPLYRDLRYDIFGPNIQNIKSLLFGNPDDNNESNTTLFLKVHEFIEKSKRFN